ncbi:MAG: hemerythrin domain-containing protein [Polyangiales bacterium]
MLVNIGAKRSNEDLRELLLDCHKKIRAFSALAVTLSEREDVAPQEVTDACERCARYFTEALPLHVADEDESIVPRMKDRADGAVREALLTMSDEHTRHRPMLTALLAALAAMRERGSTTETRAALSAIAPAVQREFEAHLQREETVIFAALPTVLSADAQREIIAELRARRAARA